MAFDEKTIAEVVRQRLGIGDASQNIRIIFQIPVALEQLARKVAANPRKRPLLLTPLEATAISTTQGAIDLEAYNLAASKKLLVEYLRTGRMFYRDMSVYNNDAGGRALAGVQSIATFELLYKVAHGITTGEPFQFPSTGSGALPGIGFALDTTYWAYAPTQAELDATGFLGAVPADYLYVASSLANAIARTKMLMNASNLGIDMNVTNGVLDTDPLHPVDVPAAKRIEDHPFYADYRFIWMDGPNLRVLGEDLDLIIGKVHFQVPYQPTLAQLANVPELHGDFIEKMVELCAGPGNDAAEDGEH